MLARTATGFLAGAAAATVVSESPAAAATTGTPDWINVVTAWNADPTGVADSTQAFKNAIDALPATGGVIYLPAGKYLISSTLTCTKVPAYFLGDGAWATTVAYSGSGDCFRVYDSSTYGTRQRFSGGFCGITIDGTAAKAGAAGLHAGDLLQYELDLTVQNFSGAGSIGVHLDNAYYWTEQLYGRIYAQYCTSHVVFDWTGTAATSSGSFERCDLDIYVNQAHAPFDGVVFQNGAFTGNGSLRIRGNFGAGSTAVTSAALRLTGSKSNANYSSSSGIVSGMLDIGVECGTGTGAPKTIAFGSASNTITSCYGALNFGLAGNKFAQSNNAGNIRGFQGPVSGDPTLPGTWITYTSGLPAGWTGHVGFRFLPTGDEVVVSWSFGIASGTVVKSGTQVTTVASQFAYSDNKVMPANISGGGLTSNQYAPAYVTKTAGFMYDGPSFTASGSAYWYGQAVYTLSVG